MTKYTQVSSYAATARAFYVLAEPDGKTAIYPVVGYRSCLTKLGYIEDVPIIATHGDLGLATPEDFTYPHVASIAVCHGEIGNDHFYLEDIEADLVKQAKAKAEMDAKVNSWHPGQKQTA